MSKSYGFEQNQRGSAAQSRDWMWIPQTTVSSSTATAAVSQSSSSIAMIDQGFRQFPTEERGGRRGVEVDMEMRQIKVGENLQQLGDDNLVNKDGATWLSLNLSSPTLPMQLPSPPSQPPPQSSTVTVKATGAARTPTLEEVMTPFDAEQRQLGRVKWYNVLNGYGYVTPLDGSSDVFVHQSVIQMEGFRSLGDDELVEFVARQSRRGREALHVCRPGGQDCMGSHRRPTSKKIRKRRCYNCGYVAKHLAAECPLGPLDKCCYFCHSALHLINECPFKQKSSSSLSSFSPFSFSRSSVTDSATAFCCIALSLSNACAASISTSTLAPRLTAASAHTHEAEIPSATRLYVDPLRADRSIPTGLQQQQQQQQRQSQQDRVEDYTQENFLAIVKSSSLSCCGPTSFSSISSFATTCSSTPYSVVSSYSMLQQFHPHSHLHRYSPSTCSIPLLAESPTSTASQSHAQHKLDRFPRYTMTTAPLATDFYTSTRVSLPSPSQPSVTAAAPARSLHIPKASDVSGAPATSSLISSSVDTHDTTRFTGIGRMIIKTGGLASHTSHHQHPTSHPQLHHYHHHHQELLHGNISYQFADFSRSSSATRSQAQPFPLPFHYEFVASNATVAGKAVPDKTAETEHAIESERLRHRFSQQNCPTYFPSSTPPLHSFSTSSNVSFTSASASTSGVDSIPLTCTSRDQVTQLTRQLQSIGFTSEQQQRVAEAQPASDSSGSRCHDQIASPEIQKHESSREDFQYFFKHRKN